MADSQSRRILITGASSGIGRALAVELGVPGTELILTGRRLETLNEAAAGARARGASVHTHRLELSSEPDVRIFAERIAQDDAGLDALVNNAAVIKLGLLAGSDAADLDWHYRVNVKAPALLISCLLPRVQERRGQFVFINSTAGLVAAKGAAFYSATKHALKAIADSLREEVKADGITVLNVFPGRTNTPMQEQVLKMEGGTADLDSFLQPADVARIIVCGMEGCRRGEFHNLTLRPHQEPCFW